MDVVKYQLLVHTQAGIEAVLERLHQPPEEEPAYQHCL